MAKLEENRVILQTELAKRVVLKYTPHLVFHLDDSIERGARVFKILQEIEIAKRRRRNDATRASRKSAPSCASISASPS